MARPNARRHSVLSRPLLASITGYQKLAEGRTSPCRFVPSCSTYAHESIQVHGAIRGTAYALRRLARCNPWGGQGYDPVPPPRGN